MTNQGAVHLGRSETHGGTDLVLKAVVIIRHPGPCFLHHRGSIYGGLESARGWDRIAYAAIKPTARASGGTDPISMGFAGPLDPFAPAIQGTSLSRSDARTRTMRGHIPAAACTVASSSARPRSRSWAATASRPRSRREGRARAPSGDAGRPGPYPGRVIEVRNPALKRDGGGGRTSVRATLNRGLVALTGADDPVEAWRIFVQPGEAVGIKVVPNGYPGRPHLTGAGPGGDRRTAVSGDPAQGHGGIRPLRAGVPHSRLSRNLARRMSPGRADAGSPGTPASWRSTSTSRTRSPATTATNSSS